MRERGEVDALGAAGRRRGRRRGRRSTISRRAATTTTRWRGPSSRLDDAERLEVEDRLVERHRQLLLGLEADGGGERLVVLDRRQVEHADDDARVGDADAHAAVELVLA